MTMISMANNMPSW